MNDHISRKGLSYLYEEKDLRRYPIYMYIVLCCLLMYVCLEGIETGQTQGESFVKLNSFYPCELYCSNNMQYYKQMNPKTDSRCILEKCSENNGSQKKIW